ncbi:MAG: hypothetical protein HYT87_19385 [Nitrospirae bacterium]|nr:hypothetical protein [Nitrospirota bacterium]
MGDWSEFPATLRVQLKLYPYRSVKDAPWSPLRKPLRECTVALISSAGFVRPDQTPFDKSALGGDSSFRELPADTDLAGLKDTHRSKSFDHSGYRRDPNLAFPLDRLKELVAEGFIGGIVDTHYSFMGSLTAVGKFVKATAPEIARRLVAQHADAALLVPV